MDPSLKIVMWTGEDLLFDVVWLIMSIIIGGLFVAAFVVFPVYYWVKDKNRRKNK